MPNAFSKLLKSYLTSFISDNILFFQSSLLHSRPKSTVGTPAYIAPEVLSRREYDGKVNNSVSYME